MGHKILFVWGQENPRSNKMLIHQVSNQFPNFTPPLLLMVSQNHLHWYSVLC